MSWIAFPWPHDNEALLCSRDDQRVVRVCITTRRQADYDSMLNKTDKTKCFKLMLLPRNDESFRTVRLSQDNIPISKGCVLPIVSNASACFAKIGGVLESLKISKLENQVKNWTFSILQKSIFTKIQYTHT